MNDFKERLLQTPSQTIGPYFAYGLNARQYNYDHTQICNGNLIINDNVRGERIIITGQVLDGENNLIADALIEIWQADTDGNYATDKNKFHGFGRIGTETGFTFHTIKPGSVEGQAPHINVIVFMRGLLVHAYTRIYFPDEENANKNDPVLNSVDESRRDTLIAQLAKTADGQMVYKFDIHMRGENETVFFDV
jgi:protocatechuate 3,4-dioxygenase alpha subunit